METQTFSLNDAVYEPFLQVSPSDWLQKKHDNNTTFLRTLPISEGEFDLIRYRIFLLIESTNDSFSPSLVIKCRSIQSTFPDLSLSIVTEEQTVFLKDDSTIEDKTPVYSIIHRDYVRLSIFRINEKDLLLLFSNKAQILFDSPIRKTSAQIKHDDTIPFLILKFKTAHDSLEEEQRGVLIQYARAAAEEERKRKEVEAAEEEERKRKEVEAAEEERKRKEVEAAEEERNALLYAAKQVGRVFLQQFEESAQQCDISDNNSIQHWISKSKQVSSETMTHLVYTYPKDYLIQILNILRGKVIVVDYHDVLSVEINTLLFERVTIQQLYDLIDEELTIDQIIRTSEIKPDILKIKNASKEHYLTSNVSQKEKIVDVPKVSSDSANNKTEGCYIATCVYGSYDCPEVWTLRRFRDHFLKESWQGRIFIKAYYATSPTLVKWFGAKGPFRAVNRKILDKLVSGLNKNGFDNKPYIDI